MRGLLRADFKRVLKDKMLLVMGILAVVFAAVTPLLYALMFSSAGMEEEPMISTFISGKAQFFGAFSPARAARPFSCPCLLPAPRC